MFGNGFPPELAGLELTGHAIRMMAERKISAGWIQQVIAAPALRVPDPDDPEIERFFRIIPENGNRVLRVAVNTRATPWRIVSVFFDRGMKGAL